MASYVSVGLVVPVIADSPGKSKTTYAIEVITTGT